MKETIIKKYDKKVIIVDFTSISELIDYLNKTEFSKAFSNSYNRNSIEISNHYTEWSKTKSFEEAKHLLVNGWDEMAKTINLKINAAKIDTKDRLISKNVCNVQGGQAIVPLYLNGCPQNMMSRKMISVKNKVVTINKNITYSWNISAEKIIEESVKAIQLINKIESQGIRCNLYVFNAVRVSGQELIFRVKIKSSSEKLNISKVAFPLVNPSMLRRIFFNVLEKYDKAFIEFNKVHGYPTDGYYLKELNENEYIIPAVIKKDINKINSLSDL